MFDSMTNKTDEIQWQNEPTTARANDQESKLCSESGIQSRSSPRMPKMITAVVQSTPGQRQRVVSFVIVNKLNCYLTTPAINIAMAMSLIARDCRLVTEHKSTASKPTNDAMVSTNPIVYKI